MISHDIGGKPVFTEQAMPTDNMSAEKGITDLLHKGRLWYERMIQCLMKIGYSITKRAEGITMKKTFAVFMMFILLVSVLSFAAAENTDHGADEDWSYAQLDNGTVLIERYIGNDTEVTVPEKLDGKTVTEIGDNAFRGYKHLTSITLSEHIVSIGAFAFADCSSLVSISIPDSVTSIGDSAFYYCKSLSSITIPDSVASIGNDAFFACRNLTVACLRDSYVQKYCQENWIDYIVPDGDCCMICSSGVNANSLAGTWSVARAKAKDSDLTVIDPNIAKLSFKEDGAFDFEYSGNSLNGTWSIENGIISISLDPQLNMHLRPDAFRVKGSEIIFRNGTVDYYLSQTPAAPYALSPAVEADSADVFNGKWRVDAEIMYGVMYTGDNSEANNLLIENGKVSTYRDNGNEEEFIQDVCNCRLIDGTLVADEMIEGVRSFIVTLREDGSIFVNLVEDHGAYTMEATAILIRKE